MKSAEETTTLKRRVTWANEHWRLFFSEMPLRKTNLQLVTRTLKTKVKTSTKINGKPVARSQDLNQTCVNDSYAGVKMDYVFQDPKLDSKVLRICW
jgi:hypothetical protein